ncbi:MAG: threonylcarbamoyl-AMP synthase [Gammaproteobacteria bacterium]|nr:threonylcarbamoyl-AMP synthase [Gammaproteobacteria bacterium]
MSQYLAVHPTHPQQRLVTRAAQIVKEGGVIVYPTDSTYALGCRLGDKVAADRIRMLRRLERDHYLTLVCRDLSELAAYARVDNQSYRVIKRYLPGPFTFVLSATREVPRRLVHRRRRTIGLRVPDNVIAQAILAALGEPMMSTTLKLPDEDLPVTDLESRRPDLEHAVDVIVDGGTGGVQPTTVVDLTDGALTVTRAGLGVVDD